MNHLVYSRLCVAAGRPSVAGKLRDAYVCYSELLFTEWKQTTFKLCQHYLRILLLAYG